jgi:hypothetical protein
MFGSLLTKVQYSSLDLSESQQENAEDRYTEKSGFVLFFVCLCLYMYRFNIVLLYIFSIVNIFVFNIISGCTDTCFKFQDNYLAWEYPGCGKYFVFMAVQGILFFLLLSLIESGILRLHKDINSLEIFSKVISQLIFVLWGKIIYFCSILFVLLSFL